MTFQPQSGDRVSDVSPACDGGLHPLLRARFSPLRFDPTHELTADEVDVLLEAARWAPSAGNSQPWAFLPARRGEGRHDVLVRHLAASSRRWAPDASVLVVNMVRRYVEGTDWEYSEFSQYDLGQAVAHMTIQAQAMGLGSRQFRAFDLAALSAELGVGEAWQVVSMTAMGVPLETPGGPRTRRAREELQQAPFAPAEG